jgi:hypothetical protein
MTLTGTDDDDVRLFANLTDECERLFEGAWLPENAWVGDHPQES